MTKKDLDLHKERQKSISEVFKKLDFQPNNNQYAVAAVTASYIKKTTKRIIIVVGPGLGKSRVWATLVHMLKGSEFRKIRVLFTSKLLMEREMFALENLKTIGI